MVSYFKTLICALILPIILGYRRSKPLGMETYEITETQLDASSTHGNWRLNDGRLNYQHTAFAGWLTITPERWFQVDLILIATIVEIRTQGSPKPEPHIYWCIKTYTVKYGYESEFLQDYRVGGVTKVRVGGMKIRVLIYTDNKGS